MTATPYDELHERCQDAVDYLQERRPEAKVVAVHGDWAYISVGYIEVGRITDVFEEDEALGIVRIPTNFPKGTRPYGIITVPYLERSDGQKIKKQERSDQKAKPVKDALDVDDLGFWSWKWSDVSHEEASDLQKAPDLIRERLRMED